MSLDQLALLILQNSTPPSTLPQPLLNTSLSPLPELLQRLPLMRILPLALLPQPVLALPTMRILPLAPLLPRLVLALPALRILPLALAVLQAPLLAHQPLSLSLSRPRLSLSYVHPMLS